jgi:hypothetical protein
MVRVRQLIRAWDARPENRQPTVAEGRGSLPFWSTRRAEKPGDVPGLTLLLRLSGRMSTSGAAAAGSASETRRHRTTLEDR